MTPNSSGEITSILEALKAGRTGASQQLFSLVYDELKVIAKNRIEAGNNWSAQTTTLVHETYLRLVKKEETSWSDRHHFFWAAARAMRDILVERARRDRAEKRGGKFKRVDLDDKMATESSPPDLIDLNEALERMALLHPDEAKIVELKYFAGLSRDQIGEILEISPSAAWRKWAFARAWLANELDAKDEKKS